MVVVGGGPVPLGLLLGGERQRDRLHAGGERGAQQQQRGAAAVLAGRGAPAAVATLPGTLLMYNGNVTAYRNLLGKSKKKEEHTHTHTKYKTKTKEKDYTMKWIQLRS